MQEIYNPHEYADLFPLITGDEFVELKSNIKERGLLNPVITLNGKILDGRNRFRACKEVGVEVKTVEYDGDNALADVLSWNLQRRHLNASQKACLAVELLPIYETEAKQRQVEAVKAGNVNRHNESPVKAKLPELAELAEQESAKPKEKQSRETAAVVTGASARYVSEVKRIQQEKPDAFELIKSGTKTIQDIKKEEKSEKLEVKKQELIKETANDIKENKPVIHHTDYGNLFHMLDKHSMDLLITDPPYSTDIDDIEGFVDDWLFDALDKVKETGRAYICIGAYPKELQAYLNKLSEQTRFIVDNPLIWTYRNTLGITPKNKYNLNYQVVLHLYTTETPELDTSITNEMFSVQDINAPDGRQGDRYHTWQKPDELAMRLIRHGSKVGDSVFDPFTCTGTFPIAAAKLDRESVGCDISEENLLIAEKRGCDVRFS